MKTGQVKFFHDKKGWGFIEFGSGEDIYVHFTDIREEGHRTLVKGEYVQFDVKNTPDGERAVNVIRLGL